MSLRKIFEDQLEQLGFSDAEVSYSLNSCQGDGVSFTGKFDLRTILERLHAQGNRDQALLYFYEQDLSDCKLVVTRGNGHYCHERSTNLDFCDDFYHLTETLNTPHFAVSLLDEIVTNDYIAQCKKLESQGYDALLACLSDGETVFEFNGPNLQIEVKAKHCDDDISDYLSGDSEYDQEDIDSYLRGEIAINAFELTIQVDGQEIYEETRAECYPTGEARSMAFNFLKDVLPGVRQEIKQALKELEGEFA